MNNKYLLSICIITYNQENYISQTLDSILNQKFDFDYEIIIGDDCSSDNTRNIIDEYYSKYPEIIKRLYNEQNLGLIKNYFNVIEHCSGKYIMECAGDDYWAEGKVLKQIDFMENNPDVGLCYGNVYSVDENNTFLSRNLNLGYEDFELLITGNTIPALTICFRNELIKRYVFEIKPLEKNWLMEDYPFELWISKNSKIKYLNEYFGYYRVLNESVSHSINVDKTLRFYKSINEVQQFFAGKKIGDILLFNESQMRFDLSFRNYLNDSTLENKFVLINSYKHLEKKTIKNFLKFTLSKIKLFVKIWKRKQS